MAPDQNASARDVQGMQFRRRFAAKARVSAVAVASAGMAVAGCLTAPHALADPAEPGVGPASPRDAVFLQDLNQIGIPYPSESEAVETAKNACGQIAAGSSVREAVDGVRATNQTLSVLQGAHFVWIAREIYCPGHRSAR